TRSAMTDGLAANIGRPPQPMLASAGRSAGVCSRDLRCLAAERARPCTHKIANGDGDLINVRFGSLCGLRSDISGGPESAKSRNRSGTDDVPLGADGIG